jgi:hypothetical protein
VEHFGPPLPEAVRSSSLHEARLSATPYLRRPAPDTVRHTGAERPKHQHTAPIGAPTDQVKSDLRGLVHDFHNGESPGTDLLQGEKNAASKDGVQQHCVANYFMTNRPLRTSSPSDHPYLLPAARKRYSVSPGATLDSFSKIAARSASLLAAA